MINSWIKKAASSIHKITFQRNLTPLNGTQIVICVILGRKKSKTVSNFIFSCLQTGDWNA